MKSARKRRAAKLKLDGARSKPAAAFLEQLENRLMLSTHRHTATPAAALPGGIIRVSGSAPTGTTVTQISHLYGMDTLSTANPAFPRFTNSGNAQFIVIIGSYAPGINDTALRTGNVNLFSAGMGIAGLSYPVIEDPLNYGGLDPTVATDTTSEIITTGMVEWAHAMAPLAKIELIEVPSQSGVIANAEMELAIQEAVRQTQLNAQVGPYNNFGVGGVVVMAETSEGEDATTDAQYDALFGYKYAKAISFIAPTGEYGGVVSTPADSPYVTAVGGTLFETDAAGKRVFETADPYSGGGASTVEPLPSFQKGLTAAGKRLRTRGIPDLSLAGFQGFGQEGLDDYFDPTPDGSAPNWFEVDSTAFPAAIFGGMVADVNELRQADSMGTIGRALNTELYAAAADNANTFYDITSGSNTVYSATKGYDLATGLGAPNATYLIPELAGVSAVASNVTFRGDLFGELNGNVSGNDVAVLSGTGSVTIGAQFLNLAITATGSNTVNGVTTEYLMTLPNTIVITRTGNSISGSGTATVTTTVNGTPPTTTTETFNISITGRVTTSRGRSHVSGTITTVDPLTGKQILFGQGDVLQGTFSA